MHTNDSPRGFVDRRDESRDTMPADPEAVLRNVKEQ
jgi:hypothetical protein